MTTAKADLIFASLPYRILHQFQKPVYDKIRQDDADFYAGLEKAGFKLDFGDDDSGLFMKYLRRGSGYYIDVGASQLIIDGKIKLVTGAGRGDHARRRQARRRHGVAGRRHRLCHRLRLDERLGRRSGQPGNGRQGRQGLGPRLGYDKGPRPLGRRTAQHVEADAAGGLWFHGGNLHQSRHYSQFLSLQLKARYEGIPTPVYGLQAVHHKA